MDGQTNLATSTAAIVGCGALGTVQASILARSGVGRLRLIDRDYVEFSNLQRQMLYTEEDAREGIPKAEAARRHLHEINSSIAIDSFIADLNPGNVRELLEGAAVILDGSDNFETRFLINDYSIKADIPWIYGAAVGSYGIAMPVLPGETSCLRCVFPEPPAGAQPTCETAGVLGPVTSMIGSIQAMEGLKLLAEKKSDVRRVIVTADLWGGRIRESPIPRRNPECPVCAQGIFAFLEGRHRAPVSLCGRNAVQIHERSRPVDLADLALRLKGLGDVRQNEFALRLSCPEHDFTIFADGRAIVKGTTDVAVARSLYSRYIGN